MHGFLDNATGQQVRSTSSRNDATGPAQGSGRHATLSTLFVVEPDLSNELQLRRAAHSAVASLWLHRVLSPHSFGSALASYCLVQGHSKVWRQGGCIGLPLMMCERGIDQRLPQQFFPPSPSFLLTQPPQNSFDSSEPHLAGVGVVGCQDTARVPASFPQYKLKQAGRRRWPDPSTLYFTPGIAEI